MHARRLFVLALAAGCLLWQAVRSEEGRVGSAADPPALSDELEPDGIGAISHHELVTTQPAVSGGVREGGPHDADGLTGTLLAAALQAEEKEAPPPRKKRGSGTGGPGPNGGGPGPGVPGPMFDAIFRALDRDGDGTLSPEEIEAAPEALNKLDKDGDGRLTLAEVMPPGGPGLGPPSPEQMLARLMQRDADQDGKLSKEEVPDFLKEHFETVDKDGDGFIDEEELKGSMQALMAAMGPRRPGGPGGPGPGGFGPGGPGPGFGPPTPLVPPEQMLEQLFATHDKDEDGKLTEEELPEPLKALLRELDESEDNALDKEELKKNAQKVMTAMGPTAGGRPGGPPLGPGGLLGGPGGPGAAGAGMMQGMARQMFTGFDQNNDGKLSPDEVPADFRKNFEVMDADGDGLLTIEEFLAAMQPGGPQNDKALINRVLRHDEDGDGQISEDEAPEFLKKHFAKLDANSDGYVDEDELQEGIATLREILGPQAKPKKKSKKAKPKAEKTEGT